MAFELGAILARLKMDTSDYEKGAKSASSQTKGLGNMISGAAGASATFAAGLAVVGASLAAAAGFALKSASGIEQTRTAFTVMLKDGDKAGKLMKDLNKFAAETPFEFPELAEAGKKLLAFGFAAKDIQPQLRRLGDVASGLGIPIGELSELYGKARVQGRLYMEDINQLTGRGIPIIGELAKQFKVSESEVRGLVESGKIGFPELEKGIKNMTDAGGMFAGGMAAQSKTVNGLISTLKDNIGAFARDLVGMGSDGSIAKGSLFAKLKDVLSNLLTWLDTNKDNIKNSIKQAFDFIKTYAPIIAGVLIGMLAPAFITAATAAGAFVLALAPFALAGAAIGLAFMALQPHFATIASFIQGTLLPIFASIWANLVSAYETVLPLFMAAWTMLQPAFTELIEVIVGQLWPALQNFFTMLVEVWQQIAPVLIPALQILGLILGGLIVSAIGLVVNAFSFVISIISSVINVIASMGGFFGTILSGIIIAVTIVAGAIGLLFTAAFTIIRIGLNTIGAIFRAVFAGIAGIVSVVFTIIGGLFRGLQALAGAILGAIVNIVRGAMSGGFTGAFRAAVDSVKSILGRIGSYVSGMVDKIKSIVGGVTEGITQPFRAAVDNIKGLMDGAKDALSNLNPFQRHSPSIVDWVKRGTKVIADEYGDMSNSIAAGTLNARQQTIGTSRMLTNISPAQVTTQGATQAQGGNAGSLTINVEGVLADSPESKRKFGEQLVSLINDKRTARGTATI